jgi:hypothetical protein
VSSEGKPIVVTVTDEMLERIDQVADGLKARGMKVERILPMTGVISGSWASQDRSALHEVGGVLSVEDEVTAELPDPDSPLQ